MGRPVEPAYGDAWKEDKAVNSWTKLSIRRTYAESTTLNLICAMDKETKHKSIHENVTLKSEVFPPQH